MMSEMPVVPNKKYNDSGSGVDQSETNGAIGNDDFIDNESISLSTNKSSYSSPSSVYRMIDDRVSTLPPMLSIDPTPNPVDIGSINDIDETDTDNIRRYI